jgi:DNA-binding CsgD family transcriptional regulator
LVPDRRVWALDARCVAAYAVGVVKRSPLVGREVERAGLGAALADCRRGEAGVVLVSGDAGVGKSRLVAEALDGWDGCVLRAAASAGAGVYAPVIAVLRAVSDVSGDEALSGEAAVLVAELAKPDVTFDQPALFAGLRRALREVARRRPTVVVLEDLHWADAATLELLPSLVASMGDEPLLVLGTYRREELPRAHPVRAMRAELRRTGQLVEFGLRPLTATETGELLAGYLDATISPELVSVVHRRAEGLPFFVEELAAALVATGGLRERDGVLDLNPDTVLPVPDSVLDAVLVRTARLRERCVAAVELAAVLGVRFDLLVLADLVEPRDVDQLIDAGLISEEGPDSAVFRHALVRDALYRAVPWGRRRGYHRLVAEHLTSRGAAPELIAEHWIGAHEHEPARALLLAAAHRHCSVHAYRDAAALARRALAIWPQDTDPEGRTSAIERLADCAELSGELDSAAELWCEVAGRRRAVGDLAGAGSAHRRLANAAQLLGDFPRAVLAREAAADAFVAAGAPGEAAAERLALAGQLKAAAHLSKALEQAVAATADAEAAGRTDVRAHSLALQGALRAALGEGRQGVALARAGLELALAWQLAEVTGEAYYELGEALEYATDYASAADAYASAVDLSRAHGFTELARTCFVCMSPVVRLMGDWDRSLAICTEVLGDRDSSQLHRMVAREESGLITALRGEPRRARAPLRQAAVFGRVNEVFGLEVGATWGMAVVSGLDGDKAPALHAVSTMLERCLAKQEWHYALPALRWAGTFLAERGVRDELALCHRLLATAATRNSAPKVLSALAHVGGELAMVDTDFDQSAAQFARAIELQHGVTAPFELALTQLRWGTALAGQGDQSAAVDHLTSAYRVARQLGAKPLARQCAAGLVDMGERVDRRLGRLAARSLEPAGLTRREREVLGLLAEGRTNREISAELFVSPRTVDMHVRNLLGKLDCSTRVGAARRAAELGLVEPTGPPKIRH